MCFLLVYLVALVPILTGMNVASAVSMLMIPTMILNAYLNIACYRIPERFPEQFSKGSIRVSPGLFRFFSILGGVCAANVAVSLFMDLTRSDAVVAVCVVALPLLFSWTALKTRSVNVDVLRENREKIIAEAVSGEEPAAAE
jgi:APA family basic amino acid/polyamine antiporter